MYVTKSPAKLAGTCSEHSWRYAVLACHSEGILASGRRIVHRYSSGNALVPRRWYPGPNPTSVLPGVIRTGDPVE